MKLYQLAGVTLLCSGALLLASCENELSSIGGSLASGEVSITIDSLHFELNPTCYVDQKFDTRSTTNLIGRISVAEYGDLDCSYVTRLMCADALPVPDSIPSSRVDSVKILMTVPRGQLTGDSLAPQQLTVYKLNRQLPSDISNDFDPTGYFDDQNPLGSVSFTLSALGMNDSTFAKKSEIVIPVSLPREFGVEMFDAYRKNSEPFQWPSSFAQYFPGIYVKPIFGAGCVANVASTKFMTWYHHLEDKTYLIDSKYETKQVHVADSVALFSSAPEVLSSNNITYKISENLHNLAESGKILLTTPGGFRAKFTMPVAEILAKYMTDNSNLQVISQLSLSIPAAPVTNDYGIGVPPSLLLVPTAKVEEFFKNGSVPDSKTSFYADYNSEKKAYVFNGMRQFIVDMAEKNSWTEDETDYTLIPVQLRKETYTQGTQTLTQIMSCVPYIVRPTMCELFMNKAMIVFTYSNQTLE